MADMIFVMLLGAGITSSVGASFTLLFGVPAILGFFFSTLLTYGAFRSHRSPIAGKSSQKSLLVFSRSSFLVCAAVYAVVFLMHFGNSFYGWGSVNMLIAFTASFLGFMLLYWFLYVRFPQMLEERSPINPFPSVLTMILGYLLTIYAIPLDLGIDGIVTPITVLLILITPFLFFSSAHKSAESKMSFKTKTLIVSILYFGILASLYVIGGKNFYLSCC